MAGKFIKVRCKCKNEQIIFGNAASDIECVICNAKLATSTGGKAQIEAQIVELLE